MGIVNRTAGMLRSLAIYHGIPLRQRRLRRFYSQFLSRGDLVFDLDEDPLEDRNLAAAAPPAALRMRDVLRAEREKLAPTSA